MNSQLPEKLITPHIPLGLKLDEGVSILQSTGITVSEESGEENCYRVNDPTYSIAIYPTGNEVGSVWYDDSTGRESTWGIEKKIEMYLERYGSLSNWKLRMENDWMRYWFNPNDNAAMVYGIQNDVIRFNQYDEENG